MKSLDLSKGVLVATCVYALTFSCVRHSATPMIHMQLADGFEGFFELTPGRKTAPLSPTATINISKPSTETELFEHFSRWHKLAVKSATGNPVPIGHLNLDPGIKVFELSGNEDRLLFLVGSDVSYKWFRSRGDFPPIEVLRNEHSEFLRGQLDKDGSSGDLVVPPR